MAGLTYFLEEVFNEGKQADEYRKRKEEEKIEKEKSLKKDQSRMRKRNAKNNDGVSVIKNPNVEKKENEWGNYDMKDNPKIQKAQMDYGKASRKATAGQPLPKSGSNKDVEDYMYRNRIRTDAQYRHNRRHPQKESVIYNPELI